MYYDRHIKVKDGFLGKGLYTDVEIPPNVPILELKGKIYLERDLPANSDNFLQVGPDKYLAPNGSTNGVDFINHSCKPNCNLSVIGNRAILYSINLITKGSQLLVDYSTTSTDSLEDWSMQCKCNQPKCRKIISGIQYLTEQQKKEYTERGLLPLFITHPNLFNKTW